MRLRLITPPTGEPLTLAEARAHLRVTHTDEDALIARLITVAREHIDGPGGILGRAILPQTWALSLDGFPSGDIALPLPPLASVDSIDYTDTDGAPQTVSASVYGVDGAAGIVYLKFGQSWPTARDERGAVVVTFTCGDASVPERLRAAMLLHIADLYANREAQGEALTPNAAYDALLLPFKRVRP